MHSKASPEPPATDAPPIVVDEPGEVALADTEVGLLADSEWQLVEFQSMDDAVGTVRPDNPSVSTMHLQGDGTVSMQFD